MGLFSTSLGAILAGVRGTSAMLQTATPGLVTQGTAAAGLVGQFPWGPHTTTGEESARVEIAGGADGIPDFYKTFAPAGSDRTATGVLAFQAASWPLIYIVRILGTTAAKATSTLIDSGGPTNIVTVTALYKGLLGNSLSAVVSDPTDADANHFKLTVTLTGASGTTTEVYDNLNYSAVGPHSTPDFTTAVLIGAITSLANGRPTNGTFTFTGGLDGTINSTAYIGTPGSPDVGISLLEGEPKIRAVVSDDCGSSLRAAVNAGLIAHAQLLQDRIACCNADSGQTVAQTRAAKAALTAAKEACFVGPWAYIADTVTGAERLVPPGVFIASLITQWPESTAISNRSAETATMLSNIRRLQADFSSSRATNTALGVMTLYRADSQFFLESDPTMYYSTDTNLGDLKVQRVTVGIALLFLAKFQRFTDYPNIQTFADVIYAAWRAELQNLENASLTTAALTSFFIEDFSTVHPFQATTSDERAAGLLKFPTVVRVGSSISHMVLFLQSSKTELG